MTLEIGQVPSPVLRPPATVMDLQRLGALSSTRLSFSRSLIRKMGRRRWQIVRAKFDLDELGDVEAKYRSQRS